jgi:recombination protein RecA
MVSPALIRAQVEARLANRVPAAFEQRPSVEMRTMPTGVGVIDAAIGGIPCGGITEIVGPALCSAGRKSLQAQLLAGATREQFCALVDATDSFDPRSAQTAGVNLDRVLWIRGGGRGVKALEQVFKSFGSIAPGERRVWAHHGRSCGNI